MPPEEDRATVIGNIHRKVGVDQTCSSEDMIADRQTHSLTHTHTLVTILCSPIGGGVTNQAVWQSWHRLGAAAAQPARQCLRCSA